MSKTKMFYVIIVVFSLLILALLVFLEKMSHKENDFEDANRDGLIRCYKKHGYAIKEAGENIPDQLARQCESEVNQELDIETH